MDEETTNNLIEKGLLFEQLLQSERFTEFLGYNYDIVKVEVDAAGEPTDDPAQVVSREMNLVEVPPEEVMKRTKAAMRKYLAESSKGAPRIVAPSIADVQRLK